VQMLGETMAAAEKFGSPRRDIHVKNHRRRHTPGRDGKANFSGLRLALPLSRSYFGTGAFRGFSMITLTRDEFRIGALTLGFKPATLRKWRHRRAIPDAAKFRLALLFGDDFQIIDPAPTLHPSKTLAALAAKYIR